MDHNRKNFSPISAASSSLTTTNTTNSNTNNNNMVLTKNLANTTPSSTVGGTVTSSNSFNVTYTKHNGNSSFGSNQKEKESNNRSGDGYYGSNNVNGRNYSKKTRGGPEPFVMLQRPTVIAKPPPITIIQKKEPENVPQLTIIRNPSRDENTKPQDSPKIQLMTKPTVTKPTTLAPRSISPAVTSLNAHVKESQLYPESEQAPKNGYTLAPHAKNGLVSPSVTTLLSKIPNESIAMPPSKTLAPPPKKTMTTTAAPPTILFSDTLYARLYTGPVMASPVRLLDDNLMFQDPLAEFMQDQTDFLVIGVLGKQGVGKSTILSLLAGNKFEEDEALKRQLLFKPASKEQREMGQHKSNGIQAFITSERTIILDVQPLLSSSLLDKAINNDKKHLHSNNDFKYYENYVEMQSIELACFILSVCHAVILVEDWFTDPNMFRLMQTAEMLMPNMQGTLTPAMANLQIGQEEVIIEHYPHFVYMLNNGEYVSKQELSEMKGVVENMLKDSKLIYKDSMSEMESHLYMRPPSPNYLKSSRKVASKSSDNVNFVVLPKVDSNKKQDWKNIPEFKGLPSMDRTVQYLQRELLGIRRIPFTSNNTVLGSNQVASSGFTERKWFNYASKVWDTIRKSSLIAEYKSLMT